MEIVKLCFSAVWITAAALLSVAVGVSLLAFGSVTCILIGLGAGLVKEVFWSWVRILAVLEKRKW